MILDVVEFDRYESEKLILKDQAILVPELKHQDILELAHMSNNDLLKTMENLKDKIM